MRATQVLTGQGLKRYIVVDDDGVLVLPAVSYLKHLDHRGYARNTLRCYAGSLSLYFTYVHQQGCDYRSPSVDDLAGFVHWLKLPHGSTKVSPGQPFLQARSNRTINLHLAAVAGLYDYLWRTGESSTDVNATMRTSTAWAARPYKRFLHHLAQNQPVEKRLLRQPEPKRRPTTLTKGQIEELVNACQSQRDRLLLRLTYESSLRIGEVLALWLEDVDVVRCQLRVVDRGPLVNDAEIKRPAAERSVDVSQELIHAIMAYAASAHTEAVETNHLFIKQRGRRAGLPLDYADVQALFRRLKRRSGVEASAHLLHHSSLTALAKQGWQPEHLQRRAGHAQFQTTYNYYVHPDDEAMRAEWERTQACSGLLLVGSGT